MAEDQAAEDLRLRDRRIYAGTGRPEPTFGALLLGLYENADKDVSREGN